MSKPSQIDKSTGSRRKNKAHGVEHEFPYIVELAVPSNGLDVRLSREITRFHVQRNTQVRFGRTRLQDGQLYCRCCFLDPTIADAFRERFVKDTNQK